ncbi:amino acid adenylation domain-containing protein [Gordonia sp. CPCC 205515]|uniref:amino acid adenylation domain-containing protein n=1 Tax=Gordonia sp. CPCC 205515 TaxID=3140791 RepID=UPI003AF37823
MTRATITAQPLTGAQTGIWYRRQLSGAGSASVFVVAQAWETHGPVHLRTLLDALTGTLAEAPALRSAFGTVDGEVVQWPGAHTIEPTVVHDMSAQPDPRAAATHWMRRRAERPIHPETDPCFEISVLQLAAPDSAEMSRAIVFLRAHHIVADVYALGLVGRRVAELYAAGRGGPAARPTWFGAVSDVLDHEARYRDSDDAARDHEFWLERSSSGDTMTSLASVRPQGDVPHVVSHAVTVDETTAHRLARLGAESGGSWGDAVTGLLAATLSRRTGTDTVVLGYPMMNRIGTPAVTVPTMVVNVVPVRIPLSPWTSILDTVTAARQAVGEIRPHARYRGADIARLAGSERPRIWLNIKAFDDHLRLGEVDVTVASVARGPVEELSITVRRSRSGEIELQLDADGGVFDRNRIERLAADLADALCDAAGRDDWHTPVAARSTPRLDPDREAVNIGGCNLGDLLAETCDNRSTGPCIVSRGSALDAPELFSAAHRLARLLIDEGIGADDRVALLLPRGIPAAIAMLAVPLAGGVLLPLDPTHPRDRIRHLLDDAQPRILLTHGESTLPNQDIRTIDTAARESRTRLNRLPDTPLVPDERRAAVRPAHLACIAYTSGSTGAPKGVMITHAALAHRLRWATRDWYGRGDGDTRTTIWKSSIGFIDGITEILGALLRGERIVVADDDTGRDPDALAELLRRERVAKLTAVPSLIRALTEVARTDGDRYSWPDLDVWVSSGEPLATPIARAARRSAPAARIINSYGSTEVTGDATYCTIGDDDRDVTIGTAVPDTHIVLLDSWLQPVPDGEIGEIHVAGVQLARGYLDRPDLTATRFIAHPTRPGHRLFRTGDLATRDHDGRLRLHGRTDRQLKIRGVRIEPTEIEQTLTDLPEVAAAVVDTRPIGPDSDPVLIGYLVPAGGVDPDTVDVARIRAALGTRLPAHLVPATLIPLAELPVSAHGKVDRRALPDPQWAAGSSQPPTTDTEILVAQGFREILGRGGESVHDDFFALGGHSLLVTRLLNRLTPRLRFRPQLRDVFDHPTVGDLAATIDTGHVPSIHDLPPITPNTGPTETELSAAQRRLWFQFRLDDATAAYHIPIVLRLNESPDPIVLGAAVRDVVERHETLRTLIVEDEHGHPVARVLPPAHAAPQVHVLETTEGCLDNAVYRCATDAFDLGAEIPIRVHLLHTGRADRPCTLLILLHHIAGDEWSSPILVDELSRAYLARRRGVAADFDHLPITYADYGTWQHHLHDHPRFVAGLEYWRSTLSDAPAELRLPYDHARPAVADHHGGRVSFPIDDHLAIHLRGAAEQHRVSMFMLVHSAVAIVLAHQGAGHDIVVGTPVSGRDDRALQALIGCFVNLAALRTDLTGNPTVTDIVARVRDADLDALSWSDIPFDTVVERLAPPRIPGAHPLFGVLVQYRAAWGIPAFGDLATAVTPIEPGTSMYDLTVDVTGHADSGLIDVRLDYATSLFDRTTIEQLGSDLRSALTLVATEPHIRLSDMDIHDDEARRTILGDWSRGPVDTLPRTTVDGLLHTATHATPTHVALRCADTTLDHHAFDAAITETAVRLQRSGIRRGDFVAVLTGRGARLPIAIAAVFRAGAVCVPVDPGYPDERIEFILADAGVRAVITDTAVETRSAAVLAGRTLLRLDEPTTRQTTDVSAELPAVTPESTALLLYTSGSTGTPKGVLLSHAALAHRLMLAAKDFGAGPSSIGVAKSATGFVDAITEMFGMLCAGGAVVLADDDTATDPAALTNLIAAERVTDVVTVPSIAQSVVADHAGDLTSPRRWVCSGEPLTGAVAQLISTAAPHAQLVNLYGCTEVTGDVAAHDVDASGTDGPVPIGRPLRGCDTYVLDPWLRPVPPGVLGEVYVGGRHLADGYHGRPAQSAERFVANPFAAAPGDRLYRTGDLARWDRTGILQLVGRSDDQITVRGIRMELGEITSHLERLDDVIEAVVVPRLSPITGATALTAYVTTRPSRETGPDADLRSRLIGRLPDPMIPTSVVVLDSFPRTPNGKVDRAALPHTEGPRTPCRPPSNDRERLLRSIFADVLGITGTDIETVGIDDDFFELGGDSIASLRVVAAAVRAGLPLTSRSMLERRTVAALAALTAENPCDDEEPTAVPPTVVGHVLRGTRRDIGDHVLTEVRRIPTPAADIESAVAALSTQHDALRLRVVPKNRLVWVTEVLPIGDPGAVVTHQQAESLEGPDVLAVAIDDAVGRVRIIDGRPLAVTVVHTDDEITVVLAGHQAALDRRALHTIAEQLTGHHVGGSSSVIDTATALDDLTRSATADNRLTELLERLGPPGDLRRPRHATETATAMARATVPAARRDDIRRGFAAACEKLPIDIDGDQRALLNDTDPAAVGSFIVPCPWTTATGDRIAGADNDLDRAWFTVLRHGHRRGRKTLKPLVPGQVYLTESFGEVARRGHREGIEADYAVVARFRYTADGSVELTVLADDAGTADALCTRWAAASGTA